MNQEAETPMLEKTYKALWSKIGGRPWTYILRDTWHRLEGIWIIGLVAAGAVAGHWLWGIIFWFLLVFALGYIAGHLFWGTRYIAGQNNENEEKEIFEDRA